jgi:hypothetical protein
LRKGISFGWSLIVTNASLHYQLAIDQSGGHLLAGLSGGHTDYQPKNPNARLRKCAFQLRLVDFWPRNWVGLPTGKTKASVPIGHNNWVRLRFADFIGLYISKKLLDVLGFYRI